MAAYLLLYLSMKGRMRERQRICHMNGKKQCRQKEENMRNVKYCVMSFKNIQTHLEELILSPQVQDNSSLIVVTKYVTFIFVNVIFLKENELDQIRKQCSHRTSFRSWNFQVNVQGLYRTRNKGEFCGMFASFVFTSWGFILFFFVFLLFFKPCYFMK